MSGIIAIFKKAFKLFFNLFGYSVLSNKSYQYLWQNDEDFKEIYKFIQARTLVSPDRAYVIYQLARRAKNFSGEVAEVGVYKGGTGWLLAKACEKKTIYLFDTFTGFKETKKREGLDFYERGDFGDVEYSAVAEFLSSNSNVKIIKGWFPESAKEIKSNFCLVHLDADVYDSILDGLEFFWGKLINGGVVVVDDYEGKHTPGVKKAVDKFCAEQKITPVLFAFHQCVLIKA